MATQSGVVSRKKERERFILDRFLERLSDPPEGKVTPHDDGEHPDFTIGGVGIELTQAFWDKTDRGSVSKRIAALRAKANRATQEEWERRGRSPVGLEVGWSDHHRPPTTKKRHTEFAKRFASAVEMLDDRRGIPSLSDDSRTIKPAWYSLPKEVRPREITYVFQLPHTDSWESPLGGAIPQLEVNHAQATVDRKEPLLRKYRERCDEVWLLIYSEDSALGSMFAGPWPDEEPITGQVRTGFDRVFFLRSGIDLSEFSAVPRLP